MAHPRYLFDTNIAIEHRLAALDTTFQMSAVVLSELMTATEPSEYEVYKALWLSGERDGRLIVPTAEDWLPATRILHLLARDRKKKAGGKSPRRQKNERKILTRESKMASQTTIAPKRVTRTASKTTTTKTARPARKESETPVNGNKRAKGGSRAKPLREMTLEELSLRAYKMTYDQLHGSKQKKK